MCPDVFPVGRRRRGGVATGRQPITQRSPLPLGAASKLHPLCWRLRRRRADGLPLIAFVAALIELGWRISEGAWGEGGGGCVLHTKRAGSHAPRHHRHRRHRRVGGEETPHSTAPERLDTPPPPQQPGSSRPSHRHS